MAPHAIPRPPTHKIALVYWVIGASCLVLFAWSAIRGDWAIAIACLLGLAIIGVARVTERISWQAGYFRGQRDLIEAMDRREE